MRLPALLLTAGLLLGTAVLGVDLLRKPGQQGQDGTPVAAVAVVPEPVTLPVIEGVPV